MPLARRTGGACHEGSDRDTSRDLDARRLERVLRLRHQHPGQHAGPHRPVALRAEDARRHRVRPHPAGARPDDVPEHDVLRLARLQAGAQDRPQRCVRAAVGGERAAHVHRHLRHHAADRGQDRRSGQGLGGRPRLGVLPELHPDGRRLHRAADPPHHPARRPARHARRRVGRRSSRCARRSRCT